MEETVEALPPLELKFRLSERWVEEKINSFLPFSTVQDDATIELLKPVKIRFLPGLFLLEVIADLEYKVKIVGKVLGKVKLELDFSQLADIDIIKVNLRNLEWLEDPKLQTRLGFGFGIKRIAGSQLEKVKAEIGPILEKKIPEIFEEFTNSNAVYESYLTQELKEFNLQLKTNVKSLFYQISPLDKWIDFQFFPVLDINVADRNNSFLSSPGPFRPGVGGGQVDFNLDVTSDFINNHISKQVVGKAIKAGSRSITIEQLNLSIGASGIMIDLYFANGEPPMMKGMLIPHLDMRTQILSFKIQQLKLENATWFWRGLLSILKSSIENRIEKSLRINIQDIARKQLESLQTKIAAEISREQLILKSYRPMIVFTELVTSSSNVVVLGKMGGFYEIWSEHLMPKDAVIA